MPIEIRTGLQGAPDEGAFEDGNTLTVIGRRLVVGENVPDFIMFRASQRLHRGNNVKSVGLAGVDNGSYLLYSVNGFLTPICADEARLCKKMMVPELISMYGLSNESPDVIESWAKKNAITHPLLSTKYTDTGIRLGLFIADYGGDLQRALFGVVGGRLVYAEYVYDQGGPLPNFNEAVLAVQVNIVRPVAVS